MKYYDINRALVNWGGEAFGNGGSDRYMTKAQYDSTYNYQIYLNYFYGGELAGDYYNDTNGYIRGVLVP